MRTNLLAILTLLAACTSPKKAENPQSGPIHYRVGGAQVIVKRGPATQSVPTSDFAWRLQQALRVPDVGVSKPEESGRRSEGPSAEDLTVIRQAELQTNRLKSLFVLHGFPEPTDLNRLLIKLRTETSAQLGQNLRQLNSAIRKKIDLWLESARVRELTAVSGPDFNILAAFLDPQLPGAKFIKIKNGNFVMGSPVEEKKREFDEWQWPVTISQSFEIGRTEVTQLQWFSVMGYNPSAFTDEKYCPGERVLITGTALCPNNPVESVSWLDVQQFVTHLNRALKDGNVYRLPTEAEWEYAARAGTATAYSFGDDEQRLKDFGWYKENSDLHSHPVALKPPNPWGLYDVHGNVWEWVQDWYHENRVGKEGRDPAGPLSGKVRINRGAGWFCKTNCARSSYRYHGKPDARFSDLGFRLVRAPNP